MVAPNRVMSNAHVVAGSDSVTVEVDGETYDAGVVSYDPNADISILDVLDLPAQPLAFAGTPAPTGADAVVLGYPGGGDCVPPRPRSARSSSLTDPTSTGHYRHPRGVHDQGDCAARKFGWSHDQSQR